MVGRGMSCGVNCYGGKRDELRSELLRWEEG